MVQKAFPFIFFSYVFLSFSININNTLPCIALFPPVMAKSLVGNNSSLFPDANFLNFILYANTNLNFQYIDYFNKYGIISQKLSPGYLVIGNDSQLGGIVTNSSKSIIAPIPFKKIKEIKESQIKQYFKKGYKIIKPPEINDSIVGMGIINASIKGKNYSFKSCQIFSRSSEAIIFYPNKPLFIDIHHSEFYPNYGFFGYISTIDSSSNKGIFLIQYYFFTYKDRQYEYKLANSTSTNNQIYFEKSGMNLTIHGLIFLEFENTSGIFNCTGEFKIFVI